ncbi:MAG: hypothetical protein ABSE81_03000 [Candidatus Omnitrophota bacterium]|jgi:hypothetical protein
MIFFRKIFWVIIKKKLFSYWRRNRNIYRCYIRHSAALEPQNPFLSDWDVVFFITASNIDELRKVRKQIDRDFKRSFIFRYLIQHSLTLPATKNAYDLCKKYYPFRSIYPIETWLSVDKEIPVTSIPTKNLSLPLDHTPENFFACYMVPALMGKIKHNIFERAFITRKLKKDYLWTEISYPRINFLSFYEVLLAEIDIWDQFYKKIEFIKNDEKITFRSGNFFSYLNFIERWRTTPNYCKDSEKVSSLWIYPASHNDNIPNVSLNLKPSISTKTCQKIISMVLKTFSGLDYTLLLGTEESMIGRINGLSGVCLLEPWLFKYQGCCLFGDPLIKGKIIKPSLQMLKQKYQEFLFYLFNRFLRQNPSPYAIYRLCFTLDYLFKHSEIILDNNELAKIYGTEFIPESKFNSRADTPKLLLSLKNKHGFDLFRSCVNS